MSAPDFSRDPERVALAEAMLNATRTSRGLPPCKLSAMASMDQEQYLIEADAAITHLGSGYRLPEATKRNAERLAQARWQLFRLRDARAKFWGEQTEVNRVNETGKALEWLRAQEIAFSDPEDNPKPVFAGMPAPEQCTATNGDHRCELPTGHQGLHEAGDLGWEEPSANECRICQHHGPDANCACRRKADPVREGERRRRRHQLAESILVQMASCRQHYSGRDAVKNALAWADAFIEAEDADNEKAMEAYRCKK